MVTILVLQSVLVLIPAAGAEGGDGDREGQDLKITKRIVVNASQTWGHVTINSTGMLVIEAEGKFFAGGMTMEDGSRLQINGGMLFVTGTDDDPDARINGSCYELIVTNGSILTVEGGQGQGTSSGGDAFLDIEVSHRVLIENSIVLVSGGWGESPIAPVTDGDLRSDEFSGGDALVSIGAWGDGTTIVRSSIKVVGGRGGDAPDGRAPDGDEGGAAGGYSSGGRVFNDVGMGGDCDVSLGGSQVKIASSLIEVVGGDGGDAGDGGPGGVTAGGGGGGYSGGIGAGAQGPAGDGGMVFGRVGMGGEANMIVDAEDYVQNGTRVVVTGGNGGDAGDGGNAYLSDPDTAQGGGGGGGYSGGGGGAEGELRGTDAGDGGPVEQLVGAGGGASFIGKTGDATITGSQILVEGGHGGTGGFAGVSTRGSGNWDWHAGGGGGSYSSGGGAGTSKATWSSGTGGSASNVTGLVASGADVYLWLDLALATITENTDLEAIPGQGGVCWMADAPGLAGGQGGGVSTRDGYRTEMIPMSRVMLLSPEPGEISSKIPVFKWARAHPATAEGKVVGYEVQMDDDPDFGSPEMSFHINSDFVAPAWLPNFTNYWRIRALYQRPWNTPAPWSMSRAITYINLPPQISDIPVFQVTVSQVTIIDLTEYISDPDDIVGHLSISSDHPNVLRTSRLNITLSFPREMGTVPLNFTVTDGLNFVDGQVMLAVTRYRHSPYLLGVTNHKLPIELKLYEGTDAWYEILVHDVDSDEFSYWTSGTWEGARAFPNGTLRVRAQKGDVGVHEFRLNVADEGDRQASHRVYVEVLNVNDPPDPPGIVSPNDRVRLQEGDLVSFSAVVSDPDLPFGQVLNVTFISNASGVLRTMQTTTLASVSSSSLPVGHHVVTVLVSDGQYSSSDQVVVIVEAPPEPSPVTPPPSEGPNMWVYIVASIVLFAVGFVAGNVRLRRVRVDEPES
jgi:hypothetical protein